MAVIGFNHYNLCAPRKLLDELKEFYCSVVGLQAGYRPPFKSFGYWLYAGDHAVLHLVEAIPNEIRTTQATTTFDHAAFTCSDLTEMEALLRERRIEYRLSHVPLTGQRQIFLRDPAGNGVELNFAEDG